MHLSKNFGQMCIQNRQDKTRQRNAEPSNVSCFQPPDPASHPSREGRRHPSAAPPLRMGLARQEQAKEGRIVANPTICSPVRGGGGWGVVMQV